MKMIVRLGRFNVIVGFLLGLLPLAHAGDCVVSFSKNEQGLAVKTEQGQLALDWYADSIVRIRFVPGQEPFKADKVTDGAKRAKNFNFDAGCTGTATFTPKASGVYQNEQTD